MSGRTAAFKVATRSASRNKKRTFFLVALIAAPIVVAVVVAGFVRANNITTEERALSDFGGATVRMVTEAPEPAVSEWMIELVREFDPEANMLLRRDVSRQWSRGGAGRPSVFGHITDFDLGNPIASEVLALTSGREPTTTNEVVLTEHLADTLGVALGDVAEIPILNREDPREMTVVGLVSHPVLWSVAEAVVVPEVVDEIVAAEPGRRGSIRAVLLVDSVMEEEIIQEVWPRWEREQYQFFPEGYEWPIPEELNFLWPELYMSLSQDQIDELLHLSETEGHSVAQEAMYEMSRGQGGNFWVQMPYVWAESRTERRIWYSENVLSTAPVVGTAVAAVLLVEVAFIAGAAFATGTRRRLREIGLMGSNGASDSHVKIAVVGEGVVVGLLGGLGGVLIGLAVLMIGRPTIQRFVPRRIGDFPVAMVDVAGPLLMALIACVLAAWYPAKAAASVPTLTALQGRMPASDPKRWVPIAGVVLAGFGTLLFTVGLASTGGRSGTAVTVFGVVFMIGGVAMLAGPLVAMLSRRVNRLPVTARLVLRDSGRHRTRAAAAVAATMVIMILPVVALAGGNSTLQSERIWGLEPSNAQALIYGQRDPDTMEVRDFGVGDREELVSIMEQVLAATPDSRGADFLAMEAEVLYPAPWQALLEGDSTGGVQTDEAWVVGESRFETESFVAIANDDLLEFFGDPRIGAALDADGMVLVGVEERINTIGFNGEEVSIAEVPVAVPPRGVPGFPRVMMTEATAASLVGGEPTRAMAILERDQSFLATINPWGNPWESIRDLGFELMYSGTTGMEQQLRFMLIVAVAAALLVVLIVVATITALSAAESDNELHTMMAVGARNSIRRKYLGLQSYMHTMLGTLLAVPLALLLVRTAVGAGWTYQTVGYFGFYDSAVLYVPWLPVIAVGVGVPLVVGLLTVAFVRSSPLTPPQRAF